MRVLSWLESTSVAVWVGESPSMWAFPGVLTLHTTGMAVLVGASWVLDLRLLGIGRHVPLSSFRWVFPAIAVGLAVNLTTGVVLFMKNATTWGTSIPFLVKMALVIASVAMLVPLRSLVRGDAAASTGAAAPNKPGEIGVNARRLAIASILAWTGAVTAGRLLAYL
jgi:hypothetical protein